MKRRGLRLQVDGIVQGVGFRPFVYALAKRLELTGWVRNTSAGVEIEVDGLPEALHEFEEALQAEAPPLARIDSLLVSSRTPNGSEQFVIVPSEIISGAYQPVSPDVSICQDCLDELFDPRDRRFRYPFINCTNCGPRFTIIEDIPYDRPLTTMAPFTMCKDCQSEYEDPMDRRFHAQPVACPICGPQVSLILHSEASNELVQGEQESDKRLQGENAIRATRELLRLGKIVAIKGLGGFHLACDANNKRTVEQLRIRKLRVDKPFALMMSDLATVKKHCYITAEEEVLLEALSRPILLLRRRPESTLPDALAPGHKTLGIMLPYTPLHYLLLEPEDGFPSELVMTSGNISEEPIATENNEALNRLGGLADAFLVHDRDIRIRCDDSVVGSIFTPTINQDITVKGANRSNQTASTNIYPFRRARGLAPCPITIPWHSAPLLAGGSELKNTFCLTKENRAFVSHHIGDLENFETLRAFEDSVVHYERLFRVKPELFAYDLHPNYLATRYIQDRAIDEEKQAIGVQHHHAHVAACMADHGLKGDSPVIGISFDGTGYGTDGAIWGGEVLLADYAGFERVFHLAYVPLPGGDLAVREPWRMAFSWLISSNIAVPNLLNLFSNTSSIDGPDHDSMAAVLHQMKSGLNSPPTSSIGRLFDAIASLIGVRHYVNYEGQAAMELECLVDEQETSAYSFDLAGSLIDASAVVQDILDDIRNGVSQNTASARFHNSLVNLVLKVCLVMRQSHMLSDVVLSGGVWQNKFLLTKSIELLTRHDFRVYIHRQVPANDGGLSLGQAAVAYWKMAH